MSPASPRAPRPPRGNLGALDGARRRDRHGAGRPGIMELQRTSSISGPQSLAYTGQVPYNYNQLEGRFKQLQGNARPARGHATPRDPPCPGLRGPGRCHMVRGSAPRPWPAAPPHLLQRGALSGSCAREKTVVTFSATQFHAFSAFTATPASGRSVLEVLPLGRSAPSPGRRPTPRSLPGGKCLATGAGP